MGAKGKKISFAKHYEPCAYLAYGDVIVGDCLAGQTIFYGPLSRDRAAPFAIPVLNAEKRFLRLRSLAYMNNHF